MIARTLPLKHVLSGVAIASGFATLFLTGSDLRFLPMATGVVASAAYCGATTAEDRKSWLEKRTAELEHEQVERIKELEAEFQLRIEVWEQEKQELLNNVDQRERAVIQRQEEMAQAREADYQLLKQQQEQLRADFERRQAALDAERKRLLDEVEGQRRLDEDYLQKERDQINQERDALGNAITARWAEITQAREDDFKRLHEQQEQLQADFDRRYQQLDGERQRLLAEVEQERHNNDEYLRERLTQLEQDRARFDAIVQETDQQLTLRQQQDLEALETQRCQIEEQFVQMRQHLETELKEREAQLIQSLDAELQDRDATIAYLQEQLRASKLKLPSLKHGYPGYVARLVIECLAKYKIAVGFRDAFMRGSEELIVLLEPLDHEPVKVHQVRDRCEEIQMLVGFGLPDVEVDDEVLQLTFPVVEEKLPVSVRDKVKKPIEIIDPVGDPLKEYMQRLAKADPSNRRLSGWICGDSGAGKSTIVNNYLCLVKRVLEEVGEDVEFIIIDGKDPDTDWRIDGVELRPQYGGINDQEEDEESEDWIENDMLAGLRAAKRDVKQRLKEARAARDAGKPLPQRRYTVYIVDEAEEGVAVYGREASGCILTVARLGRSCGVAIVVIGQNANPKGYGFEIPHLNNFNRFYLRDCARKGVQTTCLTITERNPHLEQLAAREARAKGLQLDHPHRFWGFVKISGEPGFVMQLPAPHAYSKVAAGETQAGDRPPSPSPSTAKGSSTIDLIKQAKSENPDIERLNNMFNQSDKAAIERSLHEHMRLILVVARKKQTWIGVSDMKSGRSAFKAKPYEEIAQMFFHLAELGLGEYAEQDWQGKGTPKFTKEVKPRFRTS